MIWLAIGAGVPFSVRVSVGFVAVLVSTEYVIGATLTTQAVPLQNEFVRVVGTNAVSTLAVVVRLSGSFAAAELVPSLLVAPNVKRTFVPEADAAWVSPAVVISVPDVPTWMKITWLLAIIPDRICACVDGATGEIVIVALPVPVVPVIAGVAHPGVPGDT